MNPQQNPAQRIGIFVDVANMYHSAQKLYGTNVNFEEVLTTAVADRQLVRAVAYAIKSETAEEEKFFNALEQQGYELRVKELQTFVSGHKKGDWDLGLAIDAIQLAPKIDTAVIVSGDGDYIPLVEHLRSLGCRIEVIAFRESCSSNLCHVVDGFTNLSDDKSRYLKKTNGSARSRGRSSRLSRSSKTSTDADTRSSVTKSAARSTSRSTASGSTTRSSSTTAKRPTPPKPRALSTKRSAKNPSSDTASSGRGLFGFRKGNKK